MPEEHAVTAAGAPPPAVAPAARRSERDARIDAFRGVALVMIFINHVPGNVLEKFTSPNFGFSDAAEGFVFMSGLAAALAYSGGFLMRPLWPGIAKVWSRAWLLYLVHLFVTLAALAIAAAAAQFFGVTEPLHRNNFDYIFKDSMGVLIGLPLLSHQLGYINILPLYMLFLLITPGLLLIGVRRPRLLMALSVAGWLIACQFRLNMPNYPTPGGWFFNPFAWQIVFVLGLVTGICMKRGERLVPKNRLLFWLAAGYLVFAVVWLKNQMVLDAGATILNAMRDMGFPHFIVDFEKTWVTLPRLLHIMALVYVISCLPLRGAMASIWARPLVLLGKHGLTVFAAGTVLAFVAQAIKAGFAPSAALDILLILAGLGLQLALAWSREWSGRVRARAAVAGA